MDEYPEIFIGLLVFAVFESLNSASSKPSPSIYSISDSSPKKSVQKLTFRTPPEGNLTCMGLVNTGMSCYVNSVLNSLYFVPQFHYYFQELQLLKLTGLTALIYRFVTTYGRWSIPAQLLNDIRNHFPEFQDRTMKSAHNFLLSVLQDLHNEFLLLCTPIPRQPDQFTWSRQVLSIGETFTVHVQETRTCSVCQSSIHGSTQLQSLPLNLVPSRLDRSLSIQSCLAGFLAEETDTEETAHLCRKCERDQIHTQGKKITRMGAALAIYLQRYNSSDPYTPVAIPLELDLSEWAIGSGKYSLCSAIHHSGGMEGGHYTCYAKASQGWMFFNDSSAQFRAFDQEFCNASTLFIYVKEEYK